MGYLVHLQQFEGPLGLLLYLIRKEEMDIFDINVNEITHQYLEYIRAMKELDLEVAGEFVAMAATLIHIKSRMLLPQYNEEGEVVESEDPRKELVQKLLDYQRYQEAAKKLYERPLLTRDVFSRGIRENYNLEEELAGIEIEEDGLFSLISSYRKIMRKALRAVHKVRPKVQSIASRILDLKEKLIVGARVLLRDLVEVGEGPQRARLLITFLSMLELGRMGFVSVFQNEVYGDIYIEPKKPVERNVLERVQEFDAGDAEAVAKSIINEAIEERIDMAETMSDDSAPVPLPVEGAVQLSLAEANFPTSDSMGLLHEPPGIEQMASDDEILAAEMELARAEGIAIPQAPEVSLSDAEVAAAGDDSLLASELLGDPVTPFTDGSVSATSVGADVSVGAEAGSALVGEAGAEVAADGTSDEVAFEFAAADVSVADDESVAAPVDGTATEIAEVTADGTSDDVALEFAAAEVSVADDEDIAAPVDEASAEAAAEFAAADSSIAGDADTANADVAAGETSNGIEIATAGAQLAAAAESDIDGSIAREESPARETSNEIAIETARADGATATGSDVEASTAREELAADVATDETATELAGTEEDVAESAVEASTPIADEPATSEIAAAAAGADLTVPNADMVSQSEVSNAPADSAPTDEVAAGVTPEDVAAKFGVAEIADEPVAAAPLETQEFADPEMAVAEPGPVAMESIATAEPGSNATETMAAETASTDAVSMAADSEPTTTETPAEATAAASIETMGADLTSDTEAFVTSEIPAVTEIPAIEEPAQIDEVLVAEPNVEAAEAFATETSEMDETIAMSTEAGPAAEMIEASQELAANGPAAEPLVIDQIPESIDMEAFEMAEETPVDTLLAEMEPVAVPPAIESTDAAPVAEPADSAQSDVTPSPEAGEIDEEPPTDMTT